jgi:hypothetical protein
MLELGAAQLSALDRLAKAGFKLIAIPRVEHYLAVEKEGFAALLEPTGSGLRVFGQAGYRMGEGLGMLVERPEGRAFVWHGESVVATPELAARYEQFRNELKDLLEGTISDA